MGTNTNHLPPKQAALYLVDDDAILLESLSSFLQEHGLTPVCFTNVNDFYTHACIQGAGCVISDLRMKPVDGFALQKRLNDHGSCLSLIMLTGYADVQAAVKLMKNGAHTVIEKPVDLNILLQMIREANDESRRMLNRREAIRSAQQLLAALSPEEVAVLDCAAEGKPNKAISEELSLSSRTVDRRRYSALQKLDAESVTEFAVIRTIASDPDNLLPSSEDPSS